MPPRLNESTEPIPLMASPLSTKSANRIILLGASNLTLSLRLVTHLMQQRFSGPSEILAAVGHGRAYGSANQVLLRGLPGINASGLWPQLNSIGVLPTYALLTDIGNDILYESAPEQILRQVEWCVEQLQKQSAQIIVTNLPMASIEDLSERRYTFYRNIFYPFCRLPRSETVSRVRVVYQGLIDMASRRNFTLYEQEPVWFGPDGIHVHYWKRRAFYRDVLKQFAVPGSNNKSASGESRKESGLTWQRRPEFAYKTLLGRKIHCQQPSGWLADGSSVFKY
ncbi:hypothetical protein [Nitrosomonas sp.]|uniref:hypothetical protein n=1 Tax=Nitrosomonas sp. TaxID=42353 RepID=UPI00272FD52A|nr:hypothetical protein [Nitrosomonas sp.]MDP2225295.1 hypothetical protein [Nitrosomonas sp.]